MIREMLDPGENIIWEGKPDKAAYVVGPVLLLVLAGIFFLISLIPLGIIIASGAEGELVAIPILFMVVWLIPAIIMGVVLPVYRFLNWKATNYVITDRRIYIEKGIIGRDISVREFTDIHEPEVYVDFIDKIRNCGSVYLSPRFVKAANGRKIYTLALAFLHIPEPHKVFELVKRMALDIKSDIYYPNDLRPENNTGYNTNYTKHS